MEKDDTFEKLRAAEPFALFADWYAAGAKAEAINPDAVTLATVGADNMPQARTVLLKSHSSRGFVFYTNCESRKGCALQHAPRAAMLFYWRTLGRQFSAEGDVRRLSADETAPYYHSRPRQSRIGAWASAQSRPLKALADFHAAVAAKEKEFADGDPPLPPHWRGYCLQPRRMEFWQEGAFRLHRRLEFLHTSDGWRSQLLQP